MNKIDTPEFRQLLADLWAKGARADNVTHEEEKAIIEYAEQAGQAAYNAAVSLAGETIDARNDEIAQLRAQLSAAQRTAGGDAVAKLRDLQRYTYDGAGEYTPTALGEAYLVEDVQAALAAQPVEEAAAKPTPLNDDEWRVPAKGAHAAGVELQASFRLRELYEAIGQVVAGEKELNVTRLHDWLGGEDGLTVGAVLADPDTADEDGELFRWLIGAGLKSIQIDALLMRFAPTTDVRASLKVVREWAKETP